ncbi:MAG: PAS domain S-box protein, partial [Candidatus Methanofastidiosia archaeon]
MKKVKKREKKYNIIVMTILLCICCFLAYYVHLFLGIEIIYSHFFYVPIILASLWWKRKGLVVAIFLAFLIISTHFLRYGLDIYYINDVIRASFFIVIAYVIGLISEKEAKRKEEITKERDKSQGILKTISEAISLVDRDMNILEVNAARLRMFGVDREDVIGKKCYKAFWNREEICADCPVPTILENGEEIRMEKTLASADGTIKHLDAIYVPSFDKEGNVVQVICDMRDITERKEAEEALAASKAHTESIIQNFLDTLIVVDTKAKIKAVNPATCHLLGYEEEELIGQLVNIIFAEKEEEVRQLFQFFRHPEKAKALQSQDTIRNRELTYKTKDGRLIPMSFNASVLTGKAGNITGVVAGAKDITERKRAEEKMKKILMKLEKKNVELERFLYATTHDLKTPLVTIRGFCEYLESDLK